MRIAILLTVLSASLSGVATAQTASPTSTSKPSAGASPIVGLVADDPFLGTATYRLWADATPDAKGNSDADIPTLTVFRPRNATGTAVVIAPGGAYARLAANHEGRQVADYLAARGVTAFVLRYRLGPTYMYPIPLRDAQRAVRFVRARAAEFGVAPDRVGMMGFSAGGHLAAMTGTFVEAANATAADPLDRVNSRPDFLILGYPWINAMWKNPSGVLSYCSMFKLTGDRCTSFESYSPDTHVTVQTPPTFIYHTTDDQVVPVEASVVFYRALTKAGVPAEMHIFAQGAHGSGLGLGDPSLGQWAGLLETWLRGRGLLTR